MADDLKLLFKGISFRSQDIKSYIVDLLQKFEVALLWNETSLIIPSLLPTDKDLVSGVLGLQKGIIVSSSISLQFFKLLPHLNIQWFMLLCKSMSDSVLKVFLIIISIWIMITVLTSL